MSSLDKNISINLRRIRKSRNLSLDMLAEQTGVSKSMLGQIERGESNPTVATIGKIVEGLRVPFEELIEMPEKEVTIVEKEAIPTFRMVNDSYKVYAVWPFEKGRDFEIYTIEIQPGGIYAAGSRGEGTYEYVTVSSGTLELDIEGRKYTISEGSSARFASDKKHIFKNPTDKMIRFNSVFSFGCEKISC